MAWEPDYLTLAEVKEYIGIAGSGDDVRLALAITAASRAIDEHCGRQFGVVDAAEERLYTAEARRGRWVIPVDDFQSLDDFALAYDGTAVTTYGREPVNAAQKGRPWERLTVLPADAYLTACEYKVAVTALWGWTDVPTAVKQACAIQTQRLLKRKDSPFGVAGSPELGNELRLLAKVDPDVAVTLRPYVKLAGAR